MAHLSAIVCICFHHRQTGLLRYSTFGPSPAWCCRQLWPLLTSVAPSRRLTAPVAHPLPGAERQISQGKTRDLRAICPSHLRPHPPGDIGLRASWLPRPDAASSYGLAVRQAGTLLAACFRPRLTTTPLLFGQRFLSPSSVEDPHLQVINRTPRRPNRASHGAPRHAWRTTTKKARRNGRAKPNGNTFWIQISILP